MIVLSGVAATLLLKAGAGLACLWKFALIYTKNEKVTTVARKNVCIFVESLQGSFTCITLGSFTCDSFYIPLNTSSILTHEKWKVHPLMTWITMIFVYLGVYFTWKLLSISHDIFFSKTALPLQILGSLGFKLRWKKIIENFCNFIALCKTSINFYGCNFVWRLCLI